MSAVTHQSPSHIPCMSDECFLVWCLLFIHLFISSDTNISSYCSESIILRSRSCSSLTSDYQGQTWSHCEQELCLVCVVQPTLRPQQLHTIPLNTQPDNYKCGQAIDAQGGYKMDTTFPRRPQPATSCIETSTWLAGKEESRVRTGPTWRTWNEEKEKSTGRVLGLTTERV